MSNFEGHFISGQLIAIASSFIFFNFSSNQLSLSLPETTVAVILLYASISIFSIIPDVDSNTSKPRRYIERFFLIIGLIFSVSSVYLKIFPYNYTLSFVKNNINLIQTGEIIVLGIFIIMALILSKTVGFILDNFFSHRGFFHNPAVYLILSAVIIVGCLHFEKILFIGAGGGIFIGFMVHYSLDKI